jgi:3-hydroxybutyryl-CoA dehydrogenase
VLARIVATPELEAVAHTDLVLENVTEDEAQKSDVIARLDRTCDPRVVLAADTSCIPIARLARGLAHPERVVGTHFMNPVPLKPVVEVARGPETSDAALARVEAFLTRIEKRALVIGDAPSFVSNRVLMLAVNEAARVVEEGTADAATVDRVFRECMGHAMGPLETADLIGLDTVLRSLEVLARHVDAHRFAPAALLVRLVAEGRLGRKSGRGFYPHGATP